MLSGRDLFRAAKDTLGISHFSVHFSGAVPEQTHIQKNLNNLEQLDSILILTEESSIQKHVQKRAKRCVLRSELGGGIHMTAEELSAVGPWELVERSQQERTISLVVRKVSGSVLLPGKCYKCQQRAVN